MGVPYGGWDGAMFTGPWRARTGQRALEACRFGVVDVGGWTNREFIDIQSGNVLVLETSCRITLGSMAASQITGFQGNHLPVVYLQVPVVMLLVTNEPMTAFVSRCCYTISSLSQGCVLFVFRRQNRNWMVVGVVVTHCRWWLLFMIVVVDDCCCASLLVPHDCCCRLAVDGSSYWRLLSRWFVCVLLKYSDYCCYVLLLQSWSLYIVGWCCSSLVCCCCRRWFVSFSFYCRCGCCAHSVPSDDRGWSSNLVLTQPLLFFWLWPSSIIRYIHYCRLLAALAVSHTRAMGEMFPSAAEFRWTITTVGSQQGWIAWSLARGVMLLMRVVMRWGPTWANHPMCLWVCS